MLMEHFANQTISECPLPLLDRSLFESLGGYHPGRYCGRISFDNEAICCFPCPIRNWVYSKEWNTQLHIPNYLAILSVILCCFLFLSFAVLPPEQTHRHYLSVGLLFPVLFISVGFSIPVFTNPNRCYDAITPNDLLTSKSCAWTGSLVVLGGIGCAIWVFLRSLWLHVRIFWDRDPGHWFKWGSIIFGTIMPVVFLAVVMNVTGFSYRMGKTCLPNREHALVSFWIWLVVFSALAFLLQMITTWYCFWVSMRTNRRLLPRIGGQQRGKYHRKLYLLQWRNSLFSILVTVGSIGFFIVFWMQSSKLGVLFDDPQNIVSVEKWLECQASSTVTKEECKKYAAKFTFLVNQSEVLASLILASLVGIEVSVFLFRKSMIGAWYSLIRRAFDSACCRDRPAEDDQSKSLEKSIKDIQSSPIKGGLFAEFTPTMSSGATSSIHSSKPVLSSIDNISYGLSYECEVNNVLVSATSPQRRKSSTHDSVNSTRPTMPIPSNTNIFFTTNTTGPMPITRHLSQIQPMPSPNGEERSYMPMREAPTPPRRASSVTLASPSNSTVSSKSPRRTSFRHSMGMWRDSTTPTVWEADNVRNSRISLRTIAMAGDQQVRDVISAPITDTFVLGNGTFMPQTPDQRRGGPLGSHPVQE